MGLRSIRWPQKVTVFAGIATLRAKGVGWKRIAAGITSLTCLRPRPKMCSRRIIFSFVGQTMLLYQPCACS
jgi:hypothetical protein